MPLPYKKGSNGPEIRAWQDWAYRYAASYADLIGPKDSYFGLGEEAFVKRLQSNLKIPQTGVFSELEARLTGYVYRGGTSVVTPPAARRKIWFYSNPGSGANEFVGPSFEVGERCRNILKINHQPVKSLVGGYLGLLGGNPEFSYVEATWDQYKSIEWLLDNNPDINDPEVEFWFSGYSQKADGLEDALEVLFGDGGFIHPGDKTQTPCPPGKYRHLRSRINGVIQFGNPSTKHTGIARKVRPSWLDSLIHNINKPDDFYAVALDKIRPPMYGIIVQAEMELPFFVHVLRIAVPIITKWLNFIPIGGAFGPFVQMALAGATGLNANSPLLGIFMSQAASNKDTALDQELINLLSPTGVLSSIPDLIQLVSALPGIQSHGSYVGPDIDRAYDIVAGFRR
jgi:hypothetical protein